MHLTEAGAMTSGKYEPNSKLRPFQWAEWHAQISADILQYFQRSEAYLLPDSAELLIGWGP
jgi:hypothetical protein